MECQKCHKQIPNGSKFCMHCGAKVEDTSSIVCKCGFKNPLDAIYCTNCGKKLPIKEVVGNAPKNKIDKIEAVSQKKYTIYSDFHSGLALIQLREKDKTKYGFINKRGYIQVKCNFDSIPSDFVNNISLSQNPYDNFVIIKQGNYNYSSFKVSKVNLKEQLYFIEEYKEGGRIGKVYSSSCEMLYSVKMPGFYNNILGVTRKCVIATDNENIIIYQMDGKVITIKPNFKVTILMTILSIDDNTFLLGEFIMDFKGKIICDLSNIYGGCNLLTRKVIENPHTSFVEITKKIILSRLYDKVLDIDCHGQIAIVQKNNQIGCVDISGRIIVNFNYDYGTWEEHKKNKRPVIKILSNGLIYVHNDTGTHLLNSVGETVASCDSASCEYIMDESDYWGNWEYVVFTQNGKKGLINHSGKISIPCLYDIIRPFSDGMAVVGELKKKYYTFSDKYKYGYINLSNELVLPYAFTEAYDFSDGLASVRNEKSQFYIDKIGNIQEQLKLENIIKLNG